jgi:hypothetical protein
MQGELLNALYFFLTACSLMGRGPLLRPHQLRATGPLHSSLSAPGGTG